MKRKTEKVYDDISEMAAWYDISEAVKRLEKTMAKAVKQMDFETALMLREQILRLKKKN